MSGRSDRWRALGTAGVTERKKQVSEILKKNGGQDKKGDVRSHIATVGALVPKALRRSAAMCGANPAMCAFRRFPLSVRPCRTSRGFQP